MDVAILGGSTIRIKGKLASAVINPTLEAGKTEADTVLVLQKSSDYNDSKIVEPRIRIKGPGEYEVGGMKFSVMGTGEELASHVEADSVKVLIGSGSAIEKIHDKIESLDIAVVSAESDFNHSVLTTIEPKILIVYGSKKTDVAKSLGKTSETVSKFSTTADKLPAEMQFVLLG